MAMNIPLYRPGEAGMISPTLSPMLMRLLDQRFEPDKLDIQRQQLAQQAAVHRDAMGHQQRMEQLEQPLREAKIQKYLQDAAFNKMLMGDGAQQDAPSENQDYSALKQHLQSLGAAPAQQQAQQQMPMQQMPMQRSPQAPMEQPQGVMESSAEAQPQDPMQAEQKTESIAPPFKESQGVGAVEVINPGDPFKHQWDRFAGIKGIPKKETIMDSDGNMITTWPSGKITRQRVSASSSDKKRNEGFASADSDVYKDLNNQIVGSLGPNLTYSNLSKNLNNPEWSKMVSGAPTAFGSKGRMLNLEYYKNTGTDSQKSLIAKVEGLSNKLVTQMASVFKGPFRVTEQALIETMKPRPDDTVPAAKAKLSELKSALDMETKVSKRMAQLMRKENYSAVDAFEKAKDELNADELKNNLQQKFGDEAQEGDIGRDAASLGVSMEDINHTAQLHGMSPSDVINALKQKRG